MTNQEQRRLLQQVLAKLTSGPDQELLDLVRRRCREEAGRHGPMMSDDRLKEVLTGTHVSVPRIVNRGAILQIETDHEGPYLNTKVMWFKFRGKKHVVDSREWSEMLVKFCELLAQDNPETFYLVTELVTGKRRDYFVDIKTKRNPQTVLERAKRVGDTGIYVEANLSANNTMELCRRLYASFGYCSEMDGAFEVKVV